MEVTALTIAMAGWYVQQLTPMSVCDAIPARLSLPTNGRAVVEAYIGYLLTSGLLLAAFFGGNGRPD